MDLKIGLQRAGPDHRGGPALEATEPRGLRFKRPKTKADRRTIAMGHALRHILTERKISFDDK